MKRQTPGQRVFLVRLARGDGVKRPEKLEDFATAINAAAGTRYDSSTVSRMENGDRKVTLEDCEVIAPLDPLQRGPSWIGFGDAKQPAGVGGLEIEPGPMLTPAQTARAEEKSARNDAERAAAKSAPRGRRGNGGGRPA